MASVISAIFPLSFSDTLFRDMQYAANIHRNKAYGNGKLYTYHLECVLEVASRYKKYCIDNIEYLARCEIAILHDTIEDCEQSRTKTYREIKDMCGLRVAEGTFCVTDELGRTRKEEKERTYPKIKSNPDAIYVKLADRIANYEESIKTNNIRMLKVYKEEMADLHNGIETDDFHDMWKHLDTISNYKSNL